MISVEPAGLADVYDLSIDGEPEFFCEGILVHNCDEMEAWREDENGKEVDENFNHAMAAGRYVFYGMHDVYQDDAAQSPEQQETLERAQAASGTSSVPVAVVVSSHASAFDSRSDGAEAEYAWADQV